MAASGNSPTVTERFPIFKLAHKYVLYDADTVSYIRQNYNICGVLIGDLPQAPQQNVFLGLPLELMPEEARLLVEKKLAYIVDDVKQHKRGFLGNGPDEGERRAFQAALRRQGQSAAREVTRRTDDRKKAALKKKMGTGNWNDIPEDMLKASGQHRRKDGESVEKAKSDDPTVDEDEELFDSSASSFPTRQSVSKTASTISTPALEPYAITPTTSYPPLKSTPSGPETCSDPPPTPQSYSLFKHLHDEGYFLAPGLRFGCQYMAYPGDPLRFHSHFLCNGMDWDQEFDLLDLVGGGRLGTGVKKGFLIGGKEEKIAGESDGRPDDADGRVRAFCVEWGGM